MSNTTHNLALICDYSMSFLFQSKPYLFVVFKFRTLTSDRGLVVFIVLNWPEFEHLKWQQPYFKNQILSNIEHTSFPKDDF